MAKITWKGIAEAVVGDLIGGAIRKTTRKKGKDDSEEEETTISGKVLSALKAKGLDKVVDETLSLDAFLDTARRGVMTKDPRHPYYVPAADEEGLKRLVKFLKSQKIAKRDKLTDIFGGQEVEVVMEKGEPPAKVNLRGARFMSALSHMSEEDMKDTLEGFGALDTVGEQVWEAIDSFMAPIGDFASDATSNIAYAVKEAYQKHLGPDSPLTRKAEAYLKREVHDKPRTFKDKVKRVARKIV